MALDEDALERWTVHAMEPEWIDDSWDAQPVRNSYIYLWLGIFDY